MEGEKRKTRKKLKLIYDAEIELIHKRTKVRMAVMEAVSQTNTEFNSIKSLQVIFVIFQSNAYSSNLAHSNSKSNSWSPVRA